MKEKKRERKKKGKKNAEKGHPYMCVPGGLKRKEQNLNAALVGMSWSNEDIRADVCSLPVMK